MPCRRQQRTRSSGKCKRILGQVSAPVPFECSLPCPYQVSMCCTGASYTSAQKIEVSKVKARDSDNDIFAGAGAFDVNVP